MKKLYNPNNEEDDPVEMEEEFHRMREHIFNEVIILICFASQFLFYKIINILKLLYEIQL